MGQTGLCRTEASQVDAGGELLLTGPPCIIAGPGLEDTAEALRKKMGCAGSPSVDWSSFPSGDPNVRFRWQDVQGQHVIFLFDTVDRERLFDQLSLLQQLQGFALPDSDDAPNKWKTYAQEGRYAWGRAHRVTVVIPWYRPCQMERTSRWEPQSGAPWTNSVPEGRWLDVPTARTLATLMAAEAPAPPGAGPAIALDSRPIVPLWRPPLSLFFVELHEEEPVRSAVPSKVNIRTERFVPFFLDVFKERKNFPGIDQLFVLFPDHGAFSRYKGSVEDRLGLAADHILYINKTRVGDQIKQEQKLNYELSEGGTGEKTFFDKGSHVLVIDDFTNSGSTLFGAVTLVRSLLRSSGGLMGLSEKEQIEGLPVSIFVSHLVAAYTPETVTKIRKKLAALGPTCKLYTTDSIPLTTKILEDDRQAEVLPLADFFLEYLR